MGANTKIEWCDFTMNPWHGCSKVSPGCDHCYAETMSKRNPKVLGIWGDNGSRVVASEAMWREPLKWGRQAGEDYANWQRAIESSRSEYDTVGPYERPRVFCASLADVFEDRPELVEPRDRLFRLIDATPNLDWLVLTKRPENIAKMMPPYFPGGIDSASELDEVRLSLPDSRDYEVSNFGVVYTLRGSSECCFCGAENPDGNKQKRYCSAKCRQASHYQRSKGVPDKFDRTDNLSGKHWKPQSVNVRPNVFLGVSVEDQQRADERIPILLSIPAAVRFLSVEPMLGPIDLTGLGVGSGHVWTDCLNGIRERPGNSREKCSHADWVIVGGESGHGARPFDLAWARSLRDQCKAAGVPYFMKQLGAAPQEDRDMRRLSVLHRGTDYLQLADRKGGDMDEWPEDLKNCREFPKVSL